MAVTRAKLDNAQRIQMFQQLASGALVELAFDRVLLDGEVYLEPGTAYGRFDGVFRDQRGVFIGQEIFTHPAPALPVVARASQGQTAVWQYAGI
jgi:hypothetical protein